MFAQLSTSQALVDDVHDVAPDCIFLEMLQGETGEFLELWGRSGHERVQWFGTHSIRDAAPGLSDPSIIEGALITTPFYSNRSRAESSEFFAYLKSAAPELTEGQQDVVAGIYDSLALLLLAREYTIATGSTSAVSAVQLVSAPTEDGFDEARPANMAAGLRRARVMSVDYQGALDDLDLDPVTRLPNRKYPLLVFQDREFVFLQTIE